MSDTLSSILLGSINPARLLDWYRAAFGIEPDGNGVLELGGFGVLVDSRDDVGACNSEPGRIILNITTDDARSVVAHLDGLGVRWIADLEEREHGLFATLSDPDGNYLQILQMNDDYTAAAAVTRVPSSISTSAYSGFAVDDIEAAARFYGDTVGLKVHREHGMLTLTLAAGAQVLVYPKPDHVPAAFTILNLPVDDIDVAVDELVARGVGLLQFDGLDVDAKGIARGPGPAIAWFPDPAGNILSVLQEP